MSEDLKLGTFAISPSVSSLKVHKLWKAGTEMFLTIKKKKKNQNKSRRPDAKLLQVVLSHWKWEKARLGI